MPNPHDPIEEQEQEATIEIEHLKERFNEAMDRGDGPLAQAYQDQLNKIELDLLNAEEDQEDIYR